VTNRPVINVVCAILSWGGRIFLTQRRPSDDRLGGKWECPGGKVEPGEDDYTALKRELTEELGWSPLDGGVNPKPLLEHNLVPPTVGRACRIRHYGVTGLTPFVKLNLTASMGSGWFFPSEVMGLQVCASLNLFRGAWLERYLRGE